LGVSYQDVASLVGAATNGQLTTYYQERGYQYPIYVQVPVDRRRSVEDILQLPLRPSLATASSSGTANGGTGGNGGQANGNGGGTNTSTGGTSEGGLASRQILLGQVVTPVQGTGPNQITRLNRQRYIAVSGRVSDRAASDVQADVQAAMSKIEFSSGTFWDFGDQQKRKAEEFSGLGVAVFLASGANLSNRGTTSTAISYQGSATVRLKAERKTRTEDVVKRLQAQMRKLPGVQASLNPYDLVANILGGQNQGMEVDVFGQDLTEILAKAKEVRQAMSGIAGLEAVDLAIDEASPELQWKIDRDKAAALGVSYQDVASLVGAATNGQLTTYYQERGYQYPIYV
ncbi:hypothetical protein EON77_20895, partial [bacterium]